MQVTRRRPKTPSWAFGHPEKITDFGWRAVHLTAERAKDVVKAYYGKPPARPTSIPVRMEAAKR